MFNLITDETCSDAKTVHIRSALRESLSKCVYSDSVFTSRGSFDLRDVTPLEMPCRWRTKAKSRKVERYNIGVTTKKMFWLNYGKG